MSNSETGPWPDQAPPGPIRGWEQVAVFRESFLSLLHPECAAAFRRVGETLYDWAIEDQRAFGRSKKSWLGRDVRGAALDLRFIQASLADLGCSTMWSQLTEVDLRHATAAADIAPRVASCAQFLEDITAITDRMPEPEEEPW